MNSLFRNIEKSSFLIWVVGLMSIAVVILIMFQYRWVQNVLEVNNDKFHHDVKEALHTVSYKLERRELSRLANANYGFIQRNIFPNKLISNGNAKAFGHDTLDFALNNFNVQIQSKGTGKSGFQISIGNQLQGLSMQKVVEQQFQQLFNRSRMIDEVFESMVNPKRDVMERLSKKDLDSLIKYEFADRGIDLKYDYAIYDPVQKNFVLNTSGGVDKKTNNFSVALFPNDVTGVSNFLVVDFRNKTGFMLRKIWLTLTSSAMLVLVIIFCFGYAVFTILHQKKLSEMKNDFINNMTHEFKTPIATISLACEALEDKDIASVPAMKDQYIGIIEEENKRLGSQVEKVLQIAMIEKEKLKLNISRHAIQEVVNKAIRNVQLQVESRSGELLVEDHTDKELVVEGDEVHLTNMINNLLDNANKYSLDAPKIKVSIFDDDLGVYISVEDNGCGMSQEQQNKIFEKFYRVSTGDVHDVKGFGLGLSYVKYVVDAHAGSIKVRSTLGKGSTFEVFIPLTQD